MPSIDEFGAITRLAYLGQLSFPDLIHHATQLEAQGQAVLAVVLYDTWLAHTKSPLTHAALFNVAITLTSLGELDRAEAAYLRAIAIAPGFLHPHINLGLLLERAGRFEEALAEWLWVVQNGAKNASNSQMVVLALNHLGRVSEVCRQFQDAADYLTQSLQRDPTQTDALHHWIFLRQKLCAWPVYQALNGVTEEAMRQSTSVVAMLSLSDDPVAQRVAADNFVALKVASHVPRLAPRPGYGHKKIRIAYCSSDFCLHPVSMLMVELWELHNRENFEVYGFCWSPEDGSALRQRVKASMDHFFTIHHLSDERAAQFIRSHEIDLLIDLQGQTAGARATMLAYRPATIQITYLGLPATTGLPSIDFVIADKFLIPPEWADHYSEKPLYMPEVYQVSDRQRRSAPAPSRAQCGLPADGFVFCSFNNSFKITPAVFDVWMRLLLATPHSVLWLLADNPWAQANLRQEAAQRGVSDDRLVFATRVPQDVYLARYLVADLFLDAFPFNAGSTANDCLWMGCPLLTLAGRSFASRMAGALLTAAGLPELIAYDLEAYEATALELARDPVRCLRLRAHLNAERQSGVLFDTPRFVRSLESRLVALMPS